MIYNTLYLFYPSGLFFSLTSIFLFCLNKVYYFFSLRCERQSLPLVSNLLSLNERSHLNFISFHLTVYIHNNNNTIG
jgi:hypothetical protein